MGQCGLEQGTVSNSFAEYLMNIFLKSSVFVVGDYI